MEKDVLSVISSGTAGFSKGKKLISQFIIENYEKAAFMTAGRLGKTVGVSESTVVRFAADLGYDGYPDMRRALQEMVRSRLTSVQRIEVAKQLIDDREILKWVLISDVERIQTTLDELDKVAFDSAVNMILKASHVYIIGMRSSAALSSFMGFYLNMILENVHVVQDTAVSEIHEQLRRIKSGDVCVGISYPRYSNRTIQAMKFASSLGADVIGITDAVSSPFVGISNINLFARSDMVSFLDSLVAPLSLINALVVSVGLRSEQPISDTFRELESLWTESGVYTHDGL